MEVKFIRPRSLSNPTYFYVKFCNLAQELAWCLQGEDLSMKKEGFYGEKKEGEEEEIA